MNKSESSPNPIFQFALMALGVFLAWKLVSWVFGGVGDWWEALHTDIKLVITSSIAAILGGLAAGGSGGNERDSETITAGRMKLYREIICELSSADFEGTTSPDVVKILVSRKADLLLLSSNHTLDSLFPAVDAAYKIEDTHEVISLLRSELLREFDMKAYERIRRVVSGEFATIGVRVNRASDNS